MKKTLETRLKNLNVVIASHIFATGPALELEEFLYPKVKSLLFIGHPFSFRKEKYSFKRYYIEGKIISKKKAFAWHFPEILIYLKDAFYTLYWVFALKNKINLFIGSDNFLAYLGLILKKLGKVEKVVFYTIDYSPKRFKNTVLDSLYHYFDRQCLKSCSAVWNVSLEISKAREKYEGIDPQRSAKQIVVPLGIWYNRIPKLSPDEKDKSTIVFMGHLLQKQGLDIVIKAIPLVKKEIPLIKLKIIGSGDYEVNLKRLVSKLNLDRSVEFLGYIEDHKEVEKILAKSTLAVATYKPDPDSFTYFADPGKIKNYLACGLPIVLTNVPPIAKRLIREKCGVICSYDENDVAQKILNLWKSKNTLISFSDNARRYAKYFDWNHIFFKALNELDIQ